MPTYKENTIKSGDLNRLIAEECGYYLYEVEDVMNAFAEVLAREVKNNKIVRVRGVGAFRKRTARERTFRSGITGEVYKSTTRDTLHLKAEASMIESLNEYETLDEFLKEQD